MWVPGQPPPGQVALGNVLRVESWVLLQNEANTHVTQACWRCRSCPGALGLNPRFQVEHIIIHT